MNPRFSLFHLRTFIVFFSQYLMKKDNIILSMLFIIALLSVNVVSSHTHVDFYDDRQIITEQKSTSKNVILMIADGLGYEHVKLARLVEYGYTANLTMEALPYYCNVYTENYYGEITDSAAAATALATGVKTSDRYLGLDKDKNVVKNIVEIAHELNKSTGVIATATIYHATPAGFIAHTDSRYNTEEIIKQIAESSVNVLLGGGKTDIIINNYYEQFENNYTIVENRTDLLSTTEENNLLGLFAGFSLPQEKDRNFTTIPSLAEITEKALDILSLNENGFFLMVEGSQIDWGGHDNDPVYVALETIAFDYAVKKALEYVQNNDDTILIVTSDHETGGLQVKSNTLNDTLPDSLSTEEEKRELRLARANQISVSWSTGDHSDIPVPLYAYGEPFDSLNEGIYIENTDVFHMMNQSIQGEPIAVTEKEPPEITEPTTTPEKTHWFIVFSLIPISVVAIGKKHKHKKQNQ